MKTIAPQKHQQQEYIEALRGHLKPGDTIYTILRHVSQSGMTRHITLLTLRDGTPSYCTWQVAQALQYRLNGDDGMIVSGAGMDMGFHVVYELSHALFGDGYALKQRWL